LSYLKAESGLRIGILGSRLERLNCLLGGWLVAEFRTDAAPDTLGLFPRFSAEFPACLGCSFLTWAH
jgi:hypothetical protein